MKKILLLLFISHFSFAQSPLVKQWDYRYGGSRRDELYSLQQTADKGYLLGGFSYSGINGDKTQASQGGADYWIVKTDAGGVKQWDARFGGNGVDVLHSLQQTADGGYILGGYSDSGISGDKTQVSQGYSDYWIVKTDAAGVKQWDARFGGSSDEYFTSLQQTADGGYILGGSSKSGISGDKTQASQGSYDYWMVKTDSSGVKQWDARFGGSSDDELLSLQQTAEGGYILGGFSFSGISGDKTQTSQGDDDCWIVKTDAGGIKQWDARYGGSSTDALHSLQQTDDGGYILGGLSYSGISGDKTQESQGSTDYWIVKTDSLGNKQWDKDFGGTSGEDEFGNISQTADGGYLLAGSSYSPISGDKTENNLGWEQAWIIKTDPLGNKQWDKTLQTDGTDDDEIGFAIQTKDGCYVMANYTDAVIGGDKTQATQGGYDYWFIKFCDTTKSYTAIQNITNDFTASVYPNPSNGNFTVECLNGLMPAPTSSGAGDVTISIVNTLGQQVYSSQENISFPFKKEIQLNNAFDGIYFLKIKTETISFQQKILISK